MPPHVGRTSGDMAKRWYSVSVLSNFEKRVRDSILDVVSNEGMGESIVEVCVPTEEVIEIRRGKKVNTERRFMPGYVLVKMEMSERGYHLINNIHRVTGFLGEPGKPSPLPDADVDRILNRAREGSERPRARISFDIGENVSVIDGPFEGFSGMVEDVDEDNARLKVSVSIFGRATPVDLEYTQVSKLS